MKKVYQVSNSNPEWCKYPERTDCRDCPDSLNPRLYDGGCKWLFGEPESSTPSESDALRADDEKEVST